jgi:hypothetical protein
VLQPDPTESADDQPSYTTTGGTIDVRLCYAFSPIGHMPRATLIKRAAKRRRSRRSPPKISTLEKAAVRIMRKLYEATDGQLQRWESLGNLGAVKADAAGIADAVERDWLVISGGLHSVSLTEVGRRRLK